VLWHENEKAAVICPRWVSFWTVCTRAAYLPVVKVGGETAPSQIVGRLHEVDALRAYNKALSNAVEEEPS
jgi:hypothetical protein